MMNDTVARIVEIMFQDVEANEETAAIRDEVMNNCQERYNDLVQSGMDEDDAIAAVIESLKGMDEVLAPYKTEERPILNDDADRDTNSERHLTFPAAEIHQLSVCLVNEDIRLEASDDDEYHAIWNAEENPAVDVKLVNGVLKVERRPDGHTNRKKPGHVEFDFNEDLDGFIKTEEGKIEINMDSISRTMKSLGEKIKHMFAEGVNISFGSRDSRVTVKIPKHAIPHVKVLTTSGDIVVQAVAVTELNITSTSGDINIDLEPQQYMDRLDVRTISGDIDVNAFVLGMTVSSTSGDVEIAGRADKVDISTISGDIDVRAEVTNVNFKAVSGDVDLRFASDEIRSVNGNTVSGDIDIELPDGIGVMAIQTSTRSGDVTTRYLTDGVGPTVDGSVSSMSGDITIR